MRTDGAAGRLAGKVALVTGGASGLGAAIAARFVEEGARVVAADLSCRARELGAERPAQLHIDVADPRSVEAALAAILRAHGRIDVLVNSAGVGKEVPFLETTLEDFDRLIAVNLRGSYIVGQAAAQAMVLQGRGGAILNLSSVSGMTGNVARTAYSASKAGVVGLSRAMAVDLAPYGVRVNVLAPGPIETPLVAAMHAPATRRQWVEATPQHRYGRPDEIAGGAVYLCSDDASYVTGHVLAIDGGFLGSGLTAPAA